MKGDKNVENGMVCGSYGPPKVTENSAIRWSAYEFLLDFRSNCLYLALFLRYSEILVENCPF